MYFADTITRQMDTAAMLAEILAKKIYVDTLINDSMALAILTKRLVFNSILSRQLYYRPTQKTVTTTKTVYQQKALAVWGLVGVVF